MILVAGSANLDFVTRVPHIPAPGETVLGGQMMTAAGGKGANQAVACARAGGQVAFLGALGQDVFAEPLRQSLKQSGVQDRSISVESPTGAALITVSKDGENAIAVASGANLCLEPQHLGSLEGVTHLVMQLEIPLATVSAYTSAAKRAGVNVVLNAAPAQALPAELLHNLDMLIVNQGELSALAGEAPLERQLEVMRERGPATVLVTLGAQGSLALSERGLLRQAAHPVTVRDTTGAGDTFVGVLVAGLAAGLPLESAMRRAAIGAALACTREGAQPSMPSSAEIEEALR